MTKPLTEDIATFADPAMPLEDFDQDELPGR